MSVLRVGQVNGANYHRVEVHKAQLCTFCSTYIPVDAEAWIIRGTVDQDFYCSKDCAVEDDLTS